MWVWSSVCGEYALVFRPDPSSLPGLKQPCFNSSAWRRRNLQHDLCPQSLSLSVMRRVVPVAARNQLRVEKNQTPRPSWKRSSKGYRAISQGGRQEQAKKKDLFPFPGLLTLTFNKIVGLLSDPLLTLSSPSVSPTAQRLYTSTSQWSLFPLSCNQWLLPPLSTGLILMSPQWLHWDGCQAVEDPCSGWLFLVHPRLSLWNRSSAHRFWFKALKGGSNDYLKL